MATCPSCQAEATPGFRWCGICHANVVNPKIGHLASPGRRLGAHFLDLLVPVISLFFIFIVAGLGMATGTRGGGGLGILLGFGLLVAYVIWAFKLFSRGTTPGKNMLGMRVIKEDGSSVRPRVP